MAKFLVTNQQQSSNILTAVEYLRGKFLKAEQAMGAPIKEINSDFTDETGQQWRLTVSRVASESGTPAAASE